MPRCLLDVFNNFGDAEKQNTKHLPQWDTSAARVDASDRGVNAVFLGADLTAWAKGTVEGAVLTNRC